MPSSARVRSALGCADSTAASAWRQLATGGIERSLVRRRIDLVQQLAGLDLLAFGEQPLADQSADLRAAPRSTSNGTARPGRVWLQ